MRFQDIPSWTGFQILMKNQTPILATSVGPSDLFKSGIQNQFEAERKVRQLDTYCGSLSNANDIYAHLNQNVCRR